MADERNKTYRTQGRGGRLRILLSKKPVEGPDEDEFDSLAEKESGPDTVTPEEDDIIPSKGMTFYDLGLRKAGDSWADVMKSVWPYPVDPTTFRDYWHDRLLSGDPLKESRRIPNRAEYLYFDAAFLPASETEVAERYVAGRVNQRPYIINLVDGTAVTEGKWHSGRLRWRPRADTGDWYFALESGLYYNAFFVNDSSGNGPIAYHVTTTPDPNADYAALTMKGRERVYLSPILALHNDGAPGGHVYLARRVPVSADFAAQQSGLTEFTCNVTGLPFSPIYLTQTGAIELRGKASPVLWAAIDAYYAGFFPGSVWSTTRPSIPVGGSLGDYTIDNLIAFDFILRRRWLVALIVQGRDTYYVWGNYVANPFTGLHLPPGPPRGFWNRTRIYQP